MKSVPSVALAGHLCLDLTPELGASAALTPGSLFEAGPLALALGGCVPNTGRALAGLGAQVTPFGRVGNDELGDLAISKLVSAGFDTGGLSVSPTRGTSYSVVIERPGIDRAFWHHTGANDEFDGSEVVLDGHDLLHVGYPTLLPGLVRGTGSPLAALFTRARDAGLTTSLDLAVVDEDSSAGRQDWRSILSVALAECDVVTPSLDDLTSALKITAEYSPELVDELADWLIDRGAAIVVISAGRHGMRMRTGSLNRLREGGGVLERIAERYADQALTIPALPVRHAATTNGAGDAGSAGFLYGLLRGADPEQSLSIAAATASAVIAGHMPTVSAVTAADPSLAPLFAALTPTR